MALSFHCLLPVYFFVVGRGIYNYKGGEQSAQVTFQKILRFFLRVIFLVFFYPNPYTTPSPAPPFFFLNYYFSFASRNTNS